MKLKLVLLFTRTTFNVCAGYIPVHASVTNCAFRKLNFEVLPYSEKLEQCSHAKEFFGLILNDHFCDKIYTSEIEL